jgi:hypothetical protein
VYVPLRHQGHEQLERLGRPLLQAHEDQGGWLRGRRGSAQRAHTVQQRHHQPLGEHLLTRVCILNKPSMGLRALKLLNCRIKHVPDGGVGNKLTRPLRTLLWRGKMSRALKVVEIEGPLQVTPDRGFGETCARWVA